MSIIRYASLANDKTETSTSTTGTVTIDLPEKGILTELYPQCLHTKVYSNDRNLPDYQLVTKLEVLVDGSTVVKSVTGQEARALCWLNGGPFTTTALFNGNGGDTDSYTGLPLYFNRFAGDMKAGLDLAAYSNPQLKITYDSTQTSVDGHTWDATTSPSFKYNVVAKILETAPVGFIGKYCQSREIDVWTQAASTEHTTEIPRGFDLKGLLLKTDYYETTWTAGFDKLKLDFDNGQWVPLDLDHEQVAMLFKAWYPHPVHVGFWDKAASADSADLQVLQLAGMGFTSAWGAGGELSYDMHECGGHDIVVKQSGGTAESSGVNFHVMVNGWGPMGCIYLPMKELIDGTTETVNTTQYGRIDLKVTASSGASSSAKGRVVAEYLKPNGK